MRFDYCSSSVCSGDVEKHYFNIKHGSHLMSNDCADLENAYMSRISISYMKSEI